MRDLFGRDNYEYYARLTGRILKVEDEWIFFTYPPVSFSSSEAIDTGSLKVCYEYLFGCESELLFSRKKYAICILHCSGRPEKFRPKKLVK